MKKHILILFVVLFSLTFVCAAPPFIEQQSFTEGLELTINQRNYIPIGDSYILRLHVYNHSTGEKIDNTSTICDLHFNEPDGEVALFEVFDYNVTSEEFYLKIKSGNFSTAGRYPWIIECQYDKGGAVYGGFIDGLVEVNLVGYELTEAKSISYMGMLMLLVLLFIINLIVIPLLPSKDNHDEEGTLVSINQLKYISPILYVTAYFLLMSIIFIGSNISLAYLGTTLIGDLLFKIFQMMMALALPMLVIWFIYIFYSIFQDKQMKKYIERGLIETTL